MSSVLSKPPIEEAVDPSLYDHPAGEQGEVIFDPIAKPADTNRGRVIWPYVFVVTSFHLLILLAFVPGYFSWIGLVSLPILNYFFCSLGIGAGYHRLLTHRSYSCPKWLERTFSILGVCNMQDSPARWVMIHRLHHQSSDKQPDPHSPLVTWFWSHMGWLFVENRQLSKLDTYERYARDILQDPFYLWLERRHRWVWVYVAHALLIFALGLGLGAILTNEVSGTLYMGGMFLLWGVIYRTIYTWHVTWAINSISHMWGYRNYPTDENSRNNWLCALTTNGEGWHNNHHADPRSIVHGFLHWWEIDITYCSLWLLSKVGLVYDIVPRRRMPRGWVNKTTPASVAE